jgi:hypothetical protein
MKGGDIMCKYCKMKENRKCGEKTNDNVRVMRIKDGSHILDLTLYRYAITDEEADFEPINDLVLEESVMSLGHAYEVQDKSIHINYCPFCGEKL